jgi:hypothetical protein
MEHPTEKSKMAAVGGRVLVLLALLTVMLAVSASAQAEGRFVYETCDPQLPAGNPPSVVFRDELEGNYEFVQTCAAPGGAIGLDQRVAQSFTFGVLEAAIPSTPGGWVESLTLSASAGGFHGNSGRIVRRGKQPETTESWPVSGSGDNARYFLLRTQPPTASEDAAERETVFDFLLSCPYGSTCEPGAYIAAHFLAATEVDPTPPVVTGVEGALVSGDVLRGHQAVQAQATDVGGGVRSLELKVNGIAMPGTAIGGCSIAAVENPSYKGVAATSPTPCPPSLSDLWNVDTSAPPFENGPNTVQVCASDFASTGAPNTTCSNAQTVDVDNTCTESPVAGGADLDAGFGGGTSDHLTVGFGSGTEITGQLTDQSGAPISGATICMESQSAGSQSGGRTVGTATTDGQGHFGLEVKPGANRQLLVGYRHDSFQIAKTLSLGTRARPAINLSRHKIRGGKRVVISGRLPKPDPGEHVLALQGSSAHGHRWLTFKKVTTDPEGNYSTTYRFIKPRREIGYRVRVVAPAQAGYDYESGASKAAQIKVRP